MPTPESVESMSVSAAARRLGVSATYLKGYLDGMGFSLTKVGMSLVIAPDQFRAVQERIKKTRAA